MRLYCFTIALVIVCLLAACESNEPVKFGSSELTGCWANRTSNNDTVKFERVTALPENDYGFEIKQNGVFKERKNSGWCGTPPISYADFDGKWSKDSSVLNITVGYWGGMIEYQWKIISVDENYLKIIVLKQENQD